MPSPDSNPKEKRPTKSAFLKTYPGRRIKKVHWNRSVVFNDNKAKRTRSKSPHPKTKKQSAERAMSSQQPSVTPKPKMEQRPPPVAGSSRQKPSNQRPGQSITTVASNQRPVGVSVPKTSTTQPQRTYVPQPRAQSVETQKSPRQQPSPTCVSNMYIPYMNVTVQSGGGMNVIMSPMYPMSVTNTGVQRPTGNKSGVKPGLETEASGHAGVKGQTGVKGNVQKKQPVASPPVPPAVPDSPRRLQKPPPTPRPERLPTPDLPDIAGAYFCDDPYCHGCLSKVQDNVLYSKMNPQIEAALAYMRKDKTNAKANANKK